MNYFLFLSLMSAFIYSVMRPQTNFGLVGLTVQNIAVYFSFFFGAVYIMLRDGGFKQALPPLSKVFIIGAWSTISLIYAYLSFDFGEDFINVARTAKGLLYDPIIVYILPFLLVKNLKQARQFLLIYVYVLGVLNFITLAAEAFGIDVFQINDFYQKEGNVRFGGISGNPNKTAYLLCVIIPFQIYFLGQARRKLLEVSLFGLILFEVVTIAFTGSRGGLIALLYIFFGMGLMLNDLKRLVIVPGIIGGLGLIIMLATDNSMLMSAIERIATQSSGSLENASAGRLGIWSALLEEFMSSPINMLFGSGFGTAEHLGLRARSHSLYFEILIEFGSVGLIVFSAVLVSSYRAINRLRELYDNKLGALILISMGVVNIAWFFTTLIGALELIVMAITLATICLNMESKRQRLLQHQQSILSIAKEGIEAKSSRVSGI